MTRYPPPEVRFEAGIVRDDNGCWVWTRAKNPAGYGTFNAEGRMQATHRWAYEHFIGPIPEGLQIDHLCRNRACANPDHLEAVARRVNLLRGVGAPAVNAAKTHCVRGHPLSGDNLELVALGRECRACRRLRAKWYRAQRRPPVQWGGWCRTSDLLHAHKVDMRAACGKPLFVLADDLTPEVIGAVRRCERCEEVLRAAHDIDKQQEAM